MCEKIPDKSFDCLDDIDDDIRVLVLSSALLDTLIECRNKLRIINKKDLDALRIDIKYILELCKELEEIL